MTRHARRGNKKSTLPDATPWNRLKQIKYTRLKEDDGESFSKTSNSPERVKKVKKKILKVSKKHKLKGLEKVCKKELKSNLEESSVSGTTPLLSAYGAGIGTEEAGGTQQKKKKRKSVTFGESSVVEFTSAPSKTERRRRKNVEARKMRRQKQVTCFHCRQLGHKLGECPNRGSGARRGEENEVCGMCFKCGSAEHTSKSCRVSLAPGEYPYAKCFICKEIGHLARSCPDNPRGLYPNGGGCKLCGSVEHLKANCPQKKTATEGDVGRVGGLVVSNLHASADADSPLPTPAKSTQKAARSKKRIVTF